LHPRREVVEAPKEAVDRESGRLHEILDRDEPRALVDDRQSREAADGLVNLLELRGGELVPAADLDRVATDDVVAGDETRQRLGTGPVVGVDGRLRRAGILLKRPDSDSQGPVVLDRQVHAGPGEGDVRFGPGLRAGDCEAEWLGCGAGPTGSTAAKYAAQGGAEVLLIEKRSEIGTPVRCGEGVAKRWLEEIGLSPSKEFVCHEVDGARVIAPDGRALVVDETRAGNECGYVLERALFDRYLAKEAAKAGAEIRIKT